MTQMMKQSVLQHPLQDQIHRITKIHKILMICDWQKKKACKNYDPSCLQSCGY